MSNAMEEELALSARVLTEPLSQDDPEIYEPYELDDITEERHVLP